jgi:hypothetical protein
MLPVNPLKDANGAPVIVELDMPGRQLYAQAWSCAWDGYPCICWIPTSA